MTTSQNTSSKTTVTNDTTRDVPDSTAFGLEAEATPAGTQAVLELEAVSNRLQARWHEGTPLSASLMGFMAVAAVIALGISSYLAYVSLTSSSIAGCGGSWFDCESVLNSRWSKWMGIPVSVLAIANYVGFLVSLVLVGATRAAHVRKVAGFTLVMFGFSAGAAAIWFISLQTFVLQHFCPWCLGAHACGLAISGILLWTRPLSSASMMAAAGLALLGLGTVGVTQLMSPEPEKFEIQTFDAVDEPAVEATGESDLFDAPFEAPGDDADESSEDEFLFESPTDEEDDSTSFEVRPDRVNGTNTPVAKTSGRRGAGGSLGASIGGFAAVRHSMLMIHALAVPATCGSSCAAQEQEGDQSGGQTENQQEEGQQKEESDSAPEKKERRLVAISGGKIKLDVAQWPLVGNPDAEYGFVELFDYCCPHCRNTHKTIKETLRRMGDDLAIVVLPVPLNRRCNSAVSRTGAKFSQSCELARLAVAVWRADPEKFNQFHDWMFQGYDAPRYSQALEYARKLVGREKLEAELNKKVVDSYIRKHVEIYRRVGAGTIPKLLFPRTGVIGEYSSVQGLVDFIHREGKVQKEVP